MKKKSILCNSQKNSSLMNDLNLNLRNEEIVNNVKIIAPGQGKMLVPWHAVEDIDELCFPKIFGGYKMDIPAFISYSDRAKSEVRRWDRRSCIPTRLLFMARRS